MHNLIGTMYNLAHDSSKVVDVELYGNTLLIDNTYYTIETSNITHESIVTIAFTVKENDALLLEISF